MVVWPVSRLAQSLDCVRLDKVVDVTVARSGRWVWWGRGVFGVIVVGLVVYLGVVGLDQADKWGSSIGCVIALVALVTPYLLPRHVREGTMSESAATDGVVVENSGDAEAEQGGEATTGVQTDDSDTGPVRVTRSGKAVATGPGSVANTGVRRVPAPDRGQHTDSQPESKDRA